MSCSQLFYTFLDGLPKRNVFSTKRLPPGNYVFRFDLGGLEMINFRAGRERLVEDLVSRYPHEETGIRRYMTAVERASHGTNALMMSKFVPPRMPGSKAVSRWLANAAWKLGRRTAKDVVADFVTDPELQALLGGGQMIDWNLSPGKASTSALLPVLIIRLNGRIVN
jgi:hypothetical protein